MDPLCFICDQPAAVCGHNQPSAYQAGRGGGVQIMKESDMAKKDQDLVARPWSEPMVFHDGGMTPISEYDGDDAPHPDTVGVIDEPTPAAVPPRAIVVTPEQQQKAADAAADAAAASVKKAK